MKNSIVSIVSIVLVFLTVFGCVPMSLAAPETTGIDQIDQIGIKPRIPQIEFQVADIKGKYSSASQAFLTPYNGTLNLRAIGSYGGPMGSIEVSFLGNNSQHCLVNSAVYSGYFPIYGLPAPIKQTNTSVQDVLTLPFTIKGPLTCKLLGNPTVIGYPPNNTNITIQAVAKALNNKTAGKDFIVTIKY